jgi:histidinol dehydrogenase
MNWIEQLEARRSEASENAFRVADEMIRGVRERGDRFVAEQIARFDKVEIAPEQILVRPAGVSPAADGRLARREEERPPALANAIENAIERIESFHLPQKPAPYVWRRADTTITHQVRPLKRVGIYVPGGRAVYLSTLIMCAVPARVAGVEELVVATTPSAAARPELQWTCERLGVKEIYRAGGAAGVAAMALGTQTLGRVDKIVGPGNAYVTAAKARLVGEVGIDMTAGPTELIVIADDTADVDFVLADLLAQAEHGPDSAVICVTDSERVAKGVEGRCILVRGSIEEGIAIANRLAPEHLSIQTKDATEVAARAENCGAIYCGPWSAPADGDYVLGSNHVLPTSGTARFFSPLGVYDFVKRTNVVVAGERDAVAIAADVQAIAEFEGLPLHGRSAVVRQ